MRYLGKGSLSSFLGGAVNVLWYLLLGAMILVLLAAVAAVFVPSRFIHGFSTGALSFETGSITFGFEQLTVANPRSIALGYLGFALVMIILTAAVVRQLRGIFTKLRAEAPFDPENAGRIRAIGLLVIAGMIVKSIFLSIIGWIVMENVAIRGVDLGVRVGSVDVTGILLGLLILVLAEVFHYGSELQEERNLTV